MNSLTYFDNLTCKEKNMLWGIILNKQSVPVNGLCVSWLCVLSFRVEVKEEKDTKVVPFKCYSQVKYHILI